MNLFARIIQFVREGIHRMVPYKSIEQVERLESPLSTEMTNALHQWYLLYMNKAPWLGGEAEVKSLNLPAFISSEIARQIILEVKWNITGRSPDGQTTDANGEVLMNPRAQFLKDELGKLFDVLRQKLEQGCAAGGMTIRPYPKDVHIHFDWTMAWGLYPLAFGNDGELTDVIFVDTYTEGRTTYTRLERHTTEGNSVRITQRAFKSNVPDTLGTEISLSEVRQWADLKPEVTVTNTDGQLFGWFKVASANSVDVDSPMGASVFAKAEDTIREADEQYSRLMWEYEGATLAIDVDPDVLKPKPGPGRKMVMPKLNQRLFRAVDAMKIGEDRYSVFSPAIRDANYINGLNQLLMRIEDQCGLSRGTISDANNVDARTATELKIVRQRSYATIADNQKALEVCLRDVVRAMDKYADLYGLAPEGDYEVSFEWDDSIVTDMSQQLEERLALMSAGVFSKQELRQWYFGETEAQAAAAIKKLQQEQQASMSAMLPKLPAPPDTPLEE